ncbi:MAG: hypothetical protein OEZ65_09615 [Gemmatimonadota bacterium]|nr:hypothetical protein [Gemmatimonadota bacterium]MDH5759833.1 hypothetical protein [Gemmatimonadota bacterium]
MSPRHLLYRLAVGGVRLALPAVARGRVARGVSARRDAHLRLAAWGAAHRDRGRPLVWFHAPSVGEGRQAMAVVRALRERVPEMQSAFTYFSPSAEEFARRAPVDVADVLPWDVPDVVAPVLDALAPDLLVFTRTEVWPVLAEGAAARGVRVAMVAGTVAGDAGRLGSPTRWFLRPTWARMDGVVAVGEADAERFRTMGVRPGTLSVAGDPAVDAASERIRSLDPRATHLTALRDAGAPVVVFGSTWGSDEEVILPALARLREMGEEFIPVVAPHEPGPETVSRLLAGLSRGGWRATTLSAVMAADGASRGEAVVVDGVGLLAELYTVAAAAYVGGGFGRSGLHSVIEPAAAGCPVFFGPIHHRAPAAAELSACGAGRVVRDSAEMARFLRDLLRSADSRDFMGEAGRGYISGHSGAARRCAALLVTLLNEPIIGYPE